VERDDVLRGPDRPGKNAQSLAEETDKRRHARIPISVSAEVIDIRTRSRIPGRATDLGVGGCYVDCTNAFGEGTEVEVVFYWRGNTLQLRALVSYVVGGPSAGMGLSFTGTSAHQDATLLDWLTGREAEARAAAGPKPEQAPGAAASVTKKTNPRAVQEALDELLGLLMRKQVLNASEGARIRDRLSRPEAPDAP
jgi:PilZ domain